MEDFISQEEFNAENSINPHHYQDMDSEFVQLVQTVLKSELAVEIIYDALKEMKNFSDSTSPKLALQIAIQDWEK